jgi:hypothetical protein
VLCGIGWIAADAEAKRMPRQIKITNKHLTRGIKNGLFFNEFWSPERRGRLQLLVVRQHDAL